MGEIEQLTAPSGAPEPLWSDRRIAQAFAAVALPDGTVGADEIMFVMKGLRNHYEAALTDLRTQLAAAQADNERLHGLLHELRLQGVRLASPATQLEAATTQPDWSQAPEWAMWWAVDPNGWAHWFEEEPVLALTINYSGWIPKTVNGVQIGMGLWAAELDLAFGVDWRTLKHQRTPAVSDAGTGEADE